MMSEHERGSDGLCVRCGIPSSEQGRRPCTPKPAESKRCASAREEKRKRLVEILEQLRSVEVLEYHDKNWLASGESVRFRARCLLFDEALALVGPEPG